MRDDEQGDLADVFNPWERNFRQHLVRFRELKGWTQTDLAKRLKARELRFHQQTVQRIESGERPVRLNEAHAIAAVFNVPLSSMVEVRVPADAELQYAVDQLRVQSTAFADALVEDADRWREAALNLAYTIYHRLPAEEWKFESLDAYTQWAAVWFHRADVIHRYVNAVVSGLQPNDGLPWDWSADLTQAAKDLHVDRWRGPRWEELIKLDNAALDHWLRGHKEAGHGERQEEV